ncbi:hypothetical protein [Streptomyces sp. WP-1]|uniref:hypothetical protein n=1 Tax=Streptomyces sp. WP-1 TaxID=3041497 RepID=UPI002648952D|nr:hypothetical protein [Streptomyces sp. WP-1]WKE70991.1 hypothetical protein QHG49_19155 [Streptomyces sp. WP-1]
MPETAIGSAAAAGSDCWAAHYSPDRWAHESSMVLSHFGDLDAADEEHLHLALDRTAQSGRKGTHRGHRSRIFAVASQLIYLADWMAQDEGDALVVLGG